MINEFCPLCGSSDNKLLYDVSNPVVHAERGLPGMVKKCNNCNLQFKTFKQSPVHVYNEEYAVAFKELKEYSGSHTVDFFKQILLKVTPEIKSKNEKPTLLDIGSGIGIMLETAASAGFEPVGVELSDSLAEVARSKGFNVINTDISEATINQQFDVVSMMDIIEHLENPKKILQSIKYLIKDEGELIVYTPNHDSMIVKIAHVLYKLGIKAPIENIFACSHTCFFTTHTLQTILTASGYKITEVSNFKYNTSRPGQKISVFVKAALNIFEGIGNLIGLKGFRVVIYAQPIK